jgi:hypothetical protein
MGQAPQTEREGGLRWALRFFGLRRRAPRKPPSKTTLWLYASLSVSGLALMQITDFHGFVNAVGVGLFGGCGGGWLRGVWDRDHAAAGQAKSS